MKTVLRNIALRTLVVLLLLTGMNFLYARFFYENDLQKYAPIVNAIRALPKDTRIVYIGESSNVTTSKKDLDQRSIGDFFSEYFPKLKVGQLTQSAAHAGIFKSYLEAIDPETTIETVVVTLNLRSFNAEWIHSGLETPLRKGTLMMQDGPALWNRFLLAFRNYPVSTEKERFATVNEVWKDEELKLGKHFQYQTTFEWKDALEKREEAASENPTEHARLKLAKEYVCAYAFRIDTLNNPRIADLNGIIALAKERKWRLVFNLLPENIENAEAHCGKELGDLMRQNCSLLVDYFTRRGVHVVNQLENVRDQDFVDREWPTEHYNQSGRRTIARKLAEALKEAYPKEYSEPQAAHFHNDCEGTLPWFNQHTLSTEKAASGKYASKINPDWKFSLFFQAPFEDLPKNARKKVSVQAMVSCPVYNANTMMVMDVQLDSGEQYWKAIALNELVSQKKGWQKVSHTFDIPPVEQAGKLITIYFYNGTEKDMFVDDIDIHFHE